MAAMQSHKKNPPQKLHGDRDCCCYHRPANEDRDRGRDRDRDRDMDCDRQQSKSSQDWGRGSHSEVERTCTGEKWRGTGTGVPKKQLSKAIWLQGRFSIVMLERMHQFLAGGDRKYQWPTETEGILDG